jgi:hypothetical protein
MLPWRPLGCARDGGLHLVDLLQNLLRGIRRQRGGAGRGPSRPEVPNLLEARLHGRAALTQGALHTAQLLAQRAPAPIELVDTAQGRRRGRGFGCVVELLLHTRVEIGQGLVHRGHRRVGLQLLRDLLEHPLRLLRLHPDLGDGNRLDLRLRRRFGGRCGSGGLLRLRRGRHSRKQAEREQQE